MLGVWHNVEHLEEVLSLPELEVIIKAARAQEFRNWKFQASMKGVDLPDADDDGERETGEEALERIKRRAALKARGVTDENEINEKVDRMEIFDVGLDFVEGEEEVT